MPCLAASLGKRFLSDRQHAAGAAGAVIEQVGARGELVGDRHKDQLRHQFDGIARCPVLAGLLVVRFVEAADQLFENRPHRMVVEAGVFHGAIAVQHWLGAEIDGRVEKLLDQGAENVGFR